MKIRSVWDSWRSDLYSAAKLWLRTPLLGLAIIVILALGIGMNTTIFSLIDIILFRPFPVRDPDTLVRIFSSDEKGNDFNNSSYPVYTDYRDQSTSFVGVAAYADGAPVDIRFGPQKSERVIATVVSGNYFELLGVHPEAGRLISTEDDRIQGANPVVVLSDRFWKQRYGAKAAAVGSVLRVNGHSYTVIGVAGRKFFGSGLGTVPQLWFPLAMSDSIFPEFPGMLKDRRISWLNIIARLHTAVVLQQGQAELRAIAARRALHQTQGPKDPSATLVSLRKAAMEWDLNPSIPRISRLLFTMVLLVLFMATVVAAGLFLVRAEKRQKEIAVRLAMGASRVRLIHQLVLESLFLSLIAAAAGFLFAQWSSAFFIAHAPESFPIPFESGAILMNQRVLLFTMICTAFTGVLFGLVPALPVSAAAPAASLKGEILTVERPGRRLRLRTVFVVAQIALAVLLLTGAGLLLQTLWRASAVNPGFPIENGFVASIDLAKHGYSETKGSVFLEQLLRAVKQIPEVESAALGRTVPVQNTGMRISIEVEGYHPGGEKKPNAEFNIVSPGFFRTLGVPILYGRDFSETDSAKAQPVAIVNRAMAEKIWPGQNPIGKILTNVSEGAQIIGVVGDVRYRSLRVEPQPTIYVPLGQSYMPTMTLLIRAKHDSSSVLPAIQQQLQDLDADLPLFSVQTLQEKLGLSLAQDRIVAMLLGSFGALALLLAVAGLFMVISYSTQLRFREFGIRMAVGATKSDLLQYVVSRGIAVSLTGLLIGTIAALTASRLIKNLLFGVRPNDPLTYFAILGLLFSASLAACFLPAWRATRIDPTEALRYE